MWGRCQHIRHRMPEMPQMSSLLHTPFTLHQRHTVHTKVNFNRKQHIPQFRLLLYICTFGPEAHCSYFNSLSSRQSPCRQVQINMTVQAPLHSHLDDMILMSLAFDLIAMMMHQENFCQSPWHFHPKYAAAYHIHIHYYTCHPIGQIDLCCVFVKLFPCTYIHMSQYLCTIVFLHVSLYVFKLLLHCTCMYH